jgi:trypsin
LFETNFAKQLEFQICELEVVAKMLKHLTLILFCVLCGSSASEINSDENTKIVGGTELEIKAAPFIVLLIYYKSPICGGSIISSNFILTASHCTESMSPRDLMIQSGSSEVGEGRNHYVSHIYMHPQYDGSNFNFDACLLKIFGKIFYNKFQQAIALPEENDETPVGAAVRVMGWGRTLQSSESMNFLRVVNLITLDPKECETNYEEFQITMENNKICAVHPERKDGKDSCQGDSGGPLQRLADGKLIGIVSFGMGCAKKEYPGIYAKVSSVRGWIRTVAKV